MPTSTTTYQDALARLERWTAQDGPAVNPVCRTQALTHGQRVERVVILLHGYTNCPAQFRALGEQFHARGFNVLIPRLPHHGLTDRLTPDHARLTPNDLLQTLLAALDIAHGLGERVVVMGISTGGVMAAYAAQFRPDVEVAVLLSPLFGAALIPRWLAGLARWLVSRLPNRFAWWDATTKEAIAGPPYAYPRFATRAVAAILTLAASVVAAARRAPPVVRAIRVVTTPNDEAIDRRAVADVVALWRKRAPEKVATYEFPADLPIQHDFIDPLQPQQQTAVVYPVLLDLVDDALR